MAATRGVDPLSVPSVAQHLAALGYHVVPIIPGTKAAGLEGWQNLRLAPAAIPKYFDPAKDNGIGLLLGTNVAPRCYPLGIDVDVEDEQLTERIRLAFDKPLPEKRGAKGATFIARTEEPCRKRLLRRKDPITGAQVNAVELLASGQQTVLPPSTHPKGMRYEWTGPSLLDFDPLDLPVLTPEVMMEIELATKNPNSNLFYLNDMRSGAGQGGGTIHNSVLTAVATLVALQWSDDMIWRRVARATWRALELSGVEGHGDYEPAGWEARVRKMAADARAKGFEDVKKEKIHVTAARWLVQEWRGPGKALYRDGGLMAYEDGAYRFCNSDDLRHVVATQYKEPDKVSFAHPDYVTVVNTAFDKAPRFPLKAYRRVCLANGTYDMDTGELMPWSADDYLISKLNFEHDADARCPIYEQVLRRTFARDKDGNPVSEDDIERSIACFEEFTSHTLFECLDYHKFLVIKGEPGSGKSTLRAISQLLHNPAALSAVPVQEFSNERYRTAMVGKLLNVVGEVAATTHAADDFLKSVVSGDPVQVRFLYAEPAMVVLPARILITCNEMFRVRDTSGAVERRMLLLRCDNVIPEDEQIKPAALMDQLRAELPGIFNRMVAAWARLRDRGQFDPPASHASELDSFTLENNHVLQWFKERTHQGMKLENPAYNGFKFQPTENDVLYLDFAEWAKLSGFKPMSKITWAMKLSKIKFEGLDLSPKVTWIGGRAVRLRDITVLDDRRY